MENVLTKMSLIEKDKLLHFFYGFVLFFILSFIGYLFALILVSLIAAGKELYDFKNKNKHTPDVYDFITTITPGTLMYLKFIFECGH